MFLNDANKTLDHKKKMEDIELVCKVEFTGSMVLKDIHILVSKLINIIVYSFKKCTPFSASHANILTSTAMGLS